MEINMKMNDTPKGAASELQLILEQYFGAEQQLTQSKVIRHLVQGNILGSILRVKRVRCMCVGVFLTKKVSGCSQ